MSKVRAALLVLALVVVLGVCLTIGVFVGRWLTPPSGPRPRTTATVMTQIQGLSQLVTVKYVMEKLVVLEDVKFYGENRVLLIAHGVVKAGVDLSKIRSEDVKVSGNRVLLRLPQPVITDAYLDEEKTQVVEHTTGLLRRFDKDLQQNARLEGVDQIRRAARHSGILEDASERARQQLLLLLRVLGFEEVQFE
jgi:hypothetical protein